METFSNFGERAFSQFPPDQVVPDPFGVIKVLEDVGCGAAERHREGALVLGAVWGSTLLAAVHHHVAVNNRHHNFSVQKKPPFGYCQAVQPPPAPPPQPKARY